MTNDDFSGIFDGFAGREADLISILLRIQDRFGHVSQDAVRRVARFLRVSENRVYGVASFYSAFTFTEPGERTVKVCNGTACHVNGGRNIRNALRWELGVPSGQTSADKRFSLKRGNCLGCCTLAPVVQVDGRFHQRTMVTHVKDLLTRHD